MLDNVFYRRSVQSLTREVECVVLGDKFLLDLLRQQRSAVCNILWFEMTFSESAIGVTMTIIMAVEATNAAEPIPYLRAHCMLSVKLQDSVAASVTIVHWPHVSWVKCCIR